MRIFCEGSRFFGGQIDRIEAGFRELGHEMVHDSSMADLVYINDQPHYEPALTDKLTGKIHGKVILTVLDCAPHIADFPMAKLVEQLSYADAVCTISETVRQDLLGRGGVDSRVIYQPIKPVFPTGIRRYSYKLMFCGRVNDSAKRTALGVAALKLLGYSAHEFVTVGSDVPFYGGDYSGVVSDKTLNEFYNSVEFLLFPSISEGLGLPPIEMVFAGGIPIVCNDCPTMMEWFGDIPLYRKIDPTPISLAQFLMKMRNQQERKELQLQLQQLLDHSFRDKFEPKRVAQRILDCYYQIL